MTQQSHYWAYTLGKPYFKNTHVRPFPTISKPSSGGTQGNTGQEGYSPGPRWDNKDNSQSRRREP